ncbi:DUF3995 domain-containing protein [Puerhibacterium sp. TATVAM-FAB25]|uniref:DUF3995 domain-containing protein n=1 Tax=Puerhibacterium sp. TATVAM-FAB25 TaxID=3093699 RepID=UPI00397B9457
MDQRTQARADGRQALPSAGAALIAGASALHVLWGTGSSWPARDRRELADLVAGTSEFPGSGACFTVAAVLAGAAAVVATRAGGLRGRAGRACIAGAFAVRGVAGLSGSTRSLVPWAPSDRFVDLDRRYYGPLCVAIAALVAAGLTGKGR